ncbi:hypothetical protein SAMN05661091_3817 [Paenibacillus uliginis N3/975]|uniref:Uncharacterized protein n=1 Tax=Paenibacillus uliginis N3/975 TaxID=1313296 RepID=A0A1X7HKD3_9BACL|nr:hypothetical protein [Paenibacillus uliginis]SMF87637.1 hypothetical protein SAMN05661091_3817 [Paenibacillus uliginis N3/975]
MNERYDGLLMVMIGVVAILLLSWRLNRWLMSPASSQLPGVPINERIQDHPAIELMEQEGFEVIGGKVKINLTFDTDELPLYSRLFIDYVVTDGRGDLYLVKLSRERKHLDWTGSGIRDRLMPFMLMYPECAGLLYIDMNENVVRRVTMDWSDEEWVGNDE